MFTSKPMIIYFVTLKDEIVYIGQTKLSLEVRKKQHEYNASRGKGYVIGAAIRKHGKENFIWNVHTVCYNQMDTNSTEKYLISKYKPKYNINLGGESRGVRKPNGKTPWNKGKKSDLPPWNKGRKEVRLEVLERISKSAQERKSTLVLTDLHKKALQDGRRQKYVSTNKPFICHQNNKTYILVTDAARDLGISAEGIYAVLNPKVKNKSHKGYTFSYI